MTLEFRCPRCGSQVRGGARYCASCGLDLERPIPPPPAPVPAPPLPYIPEGTPTVWVGPERSQTMPVGAPVGTGRSVIAALTPARPATGIFWVGLVLSILALLVFACPTLLAFAIAVDPEQEQSGNLLQGALGVSCCLFFGLLAPGVLFLAVGKPRRM